jgi:hypothetical protein
MMDHIQNPTAVNRLVTLLNCYLLPIPMCPPARENVYPSKNGFQYTIINICFNIINLFLQGRK